MSDLITPSADGPAPDQRLTARVVARIKDAHRAAGGRRRTGPAAGRPPRGTDSEARALRRVFLDFGDSYRSYRRRTGEPVSPEVREAALQFRRQLDLGSLVSVAATLERLDHDLLG
jgi:hypothetical protein